VSATEALDAQPYLIGLWQADEIVSACFGFLFCSFPRRTLIIFSMPTIPRQKTFWEGFLELCRKLKVWRLQISTYGSPAGEVPHLPGELARNTRWEYVLDLTCEKLLGGVSSHHRRNMSREAQAGLRVQRTRSASSCTEHLELMRTSLQRRADRGEAVNTDLTNVRELALLASGCGEIFQAVSGERVLSSSLVLRSGAYYLSTGSSPDGLKLGSSPFLTWQIASILQQEGIRLFNLGGTGADNPGLRRFKAGFGAREVELQAATFCPKSVVERKVHGSLRAGLAWIKQ